MTDHKRQTKAKYTNTAEKIQSVSRNSTGTTNTRYKDNQKSNGQKSNTKSTKASTPGTNVRNGLGEKHKQVLPTGRLITN